MALSVSGSADDAVPVQLVVKHTGSGLPKVPSTPHQSVIHKMKVK